MQATRSSHHTLKFDSEFVTYIWSSVLLRTQFEILGKLQRVHSERSYKVPASTPNTITQVILTQTWPTLDVQNFVEHWRIPCAVEMINLFCALRRRQWRSGLQKIVCYFNKISNVLVWREQHVSNFKRRTKEIFRAFLTSSTLLLEHYECSWSLLPFVLRHHLLADWKLDNFCV
jgi:hypothetical protein